MIWIDAKITHRSEVVEFQRRLRRLPGGRAFSEDRLAQFELILVELGTNLVKHAGAGRFLFREGEDEQRGWFRDLIALDKGPGMRRPERWFEDGASTSGTLGGGLGAARRLADSLDIHSVPGLGTAIFVRFYAKKLDHRTRAAANAAAPKRLIVDAVCVPKPGEEACGDGWAVHRRPGAWDILVIDGLGHGPEAARVAGRAVALFEKYRDDAGPEETIHRLHNGLRDTRGGAVAVARLRPGAGRMVFAGVGNIAVRIVHPDGRTRGVPSYYGIVGENLLKVRPVELPWRRDQTVVFHSDGLSDRWRTADYPGLLEHSPTVIAAVLYRDFWRERDDVTVLVAKGAP